MGIVAVDLDKIYLDDDNNSYEDDSDDIIHIRLLAWCNKFENIKALEKKIYGELMSVACILQDSVVSPWQNVKQME